MFDKLLKLANELDRLGMFEEADYIDEMLRSFAADEIDPEEGPIDLTEEEAPAAPPAVMPEPPAVDEMAKMREEFERLKKENEALKLKKLRETPSGGIKVSPKGAISVYGLGKWPVTLYAGQWQRLLDMKEKILQFIETNKSLLKTKE